MAETRDESVFSIRVGKDYLSFSAAHFVTLDECPCEALHGHNYLVQATVMGQLDESGCILDFTRLKGMLKDIVDKLDHRVLLPTDNEHVVIECIEAQVRVQYADRVYVFPKDDTVLLPVANTTAELLAEYLALELRKRLIAIGLATAGAVRMDVEETRQQSASCCLDLTVGHARTRGVRLVQEPNVQEPPLDAPLGKGRGPGNRTPVERHGGA